MRRGKLALISLVAVAATVGCVLAVSAFAAKPATTGIPGTFATINVKLTDKAVILSKHGSSGVQVIGFRIRNVGKKSHNFIVGTYATNAIAPGQFDDFAVAFDDFGTYHYRCTLNCTKSERGTINVKRGNYVDNGN